MLQSDLYDYRDPYIVVKRANTLTNPVNNACDRKLTFEYNALFASCISKINNTLINNAEDLDIALPMYNLTEYSKNYSKTSVSIWNYYRNEQNSGKERNINYSNKDSQSFDYKTSITEKLENNSRRKHVEIVIPVKYLSNSW